MVVAAQAWLSRSPLVRLCVGGTASTAVPSAVRPTAGCRDLEDYFGTCASNALAGLKSLRPCSRLELECSMKLHGTEGGLWRGQRLFCEDACPLASQNEKPSKSAR